MNILRAAIVYVMCWWTKCSSACQDVEFVPRETWGARVPRSTEQMPIPVKHIFIHHTQGRECFDKTTCMKLMRGIQDFHMDDRGWDDIGYNFLIGGDGRVYVGRSWTRVGAHTYGFNNISIAFSLMGNFMKKRPNAAMLQTAKNMIACAREQGYVTADAKIHGHRDAGCTDCPGDELYQIIKSWPNFVGGPLPGWKCWKPPKTQNDEPTPF